MAANKYRGEVDLTIGEFSFTPKMTPATVLALEGKLGSILGLARRMATGELRMGEIVDMLDIMSRDAKGVSPLTRDEVYEAVLENGFGSYGKVLSEFLMFAISGRPKEEPTEDAGKNAPPPPPAKEQPKAEKA